MHDRYIMDPMDMKVEHPFDMQHHPHHQEYAPDQMLEVSGEHSSNNSPENDYGSFDFNAHSDTTMYNRPFQPPFSAAQQLHPLNTNTATLWPSQITNPPEQSSPPVALPIHRSIAPVTQSIPAPAPPAPSPVRQSGNSNRKTLSDDDRRRMCRYHDEHPSVKQTEIGAMFGVERSTVSKVLRNKEKYLIPEDGNRSPVKRSKSKFPDIERTLLNWVKNRLAEGLPVDDELIKDEARKFASTLGSADSHSVVNDPIWLEKFKSKNNLPGGKRRNSKQEKDNMSPRSKSGSQTPNGVTASPTVGWDGMPVNQAKDEFKTKSPDSYYESNLSWTQSHSHSQSSASLGSCFSDGTIASSYTGDFRSPSSPYFSPLSSCGPSPAMAAPTPKSARLPPLAPANSLRRRQTVPLVGSSESPDSPNPKTHLLTTTNLGSHPDPMDISPLGIESSRPSTTIPTPVGTSPLSMAPPPNAPGSSPTISPSKDEARDALKTLMDYMRRCPEGTIDPHDYIVMGKLMQMLKLEGGGLPGGMHSISLMTERADGTAPMGRKRSEHSLS